MNATQAQAKIGRLETRITKAKQDLATWRAEVKALKLQLIEARAAAKAAKANGKPKSKPAMATSEAAK